LAAVRRGRRPRPSRRDHDGHRDQVTGRSPRARGERSVSRQAFPPRAPAVTRTASRASRHGPSSSCRS
jgi:hypothetical protein